MADDVTEKVSMNWPADLKEQVRKLVGARGVTAFTITAVRKELELRLSQRDAELPQQAPGGGEPTTEEARDVEDQGVVGSAPAPQAAQETSPAPAGPPAEPVEHQGEAGPDYRGAAVAVDAPPTLGVAAKFSSSSSALEELRRKGAELGIKTASELPAPTHPRRDDDPPHEVPEPAYKGPEPTKVAAVERVEPDQVPATAVLPNRPVTYAERNLDDIEIDF